MQYTPGMAPMDPQALPAFVEQELQAIARAMAQATPAAYLSTLFVAPTKPREGMVVLADGAHWNPGSGNGFYGYRSGAWQFLG